MKIDDLRNNLDSLKERVDAMKISESDNQLLSEFIHCMELLVEDRECLLLILKEYVVPGFKRMYCMMGTENDRLGIDLIDKFIQPERETEEL